MPFSKRAGAGDRGGRGRSEVALPPPAWTGLLSVTQVWSFNIWWCPVGSFAQVPPPNPGPILFLLIPLPFPYPSPHLLGEFHHPPKELHVQSARRSCLWGARKEWKWGSHEVEGRGKHQKCPALHAASLPELHSIICEMCSTEKLFKMPHTKCSQSPHFICLASLIVSKVKTACFSLSHKEVYHFSFYTLSLYFSAVYSSKEIPH